MTADWHARVFREPLVQPDRRSCGVPVPGARRSSGCSRNGVPVWLTQRLWLGTILFGAGAGVLFLARTLRWVGPGPVVAALAYALTPFTLQHATHLSVLLLPYAVLPWLIGFTIRALRAGGWRWPAWFAIRGCARGEHQRHRPLCVLSAPSSC